jgi:hypothetical protein
MPVSLLMVFVTEANLEEGQLRRLKSMFNKVKSLKFLLGTRRTNVSKGR